MPSVTINAQLALVISTICTILNTIQSECSQVMSSSFGYIKKGIYWGIPPSHPTEAADKSVVLLPQNQFQSAITTTILSKMPAKRQLLAVIMMALVTWMHCDDRVGHKDEVGWIIMVEVGWIIMVDCNANKQELAVACLATRACCCMSCNKSLLLHVLQQELAVAGLATRACCCMSCNKSLLLHVLQQELAVACLATRACCCMSCNKSLLLHVLQQELAVACLATRACCSIASYPAPSLSLLTETIITDR